MNRITALKILNPILAVLFLSQMLSGFFAGRLSREAFEILHKGGGVALAIGVGLHVALNGNWIKASYRRARAPQG